MKRRGTLLMAFALAIASVVAGPSVKAQAQAFTGKWVFEGPKGPSILEFFPGERKLLGPTRGYFRHTVVLDNGKVINGDGSYVFRHIGPNRGWLTLHFSDGHVTTEHEHTVGGTVLSIRHHGLTRNYTRQ